jgi:hypothetical protein
MWIVWQGFLELLSLEYSLFRKDFPAIYDKVRNAPVCARPRGTITAEQVCSAIDLAATLYFKQTRCLQRSAAAVCLLKRHGFAAEMVIGIQQVPFLAHAWVELDGLVLNDRPYMPEIYSVLARC